MNVRSEYELIIFSSLIMPKKSPSYLLNLIVYDEKECYDIMHRLLCNLNEFMCILCRATQMNSWQILEIIFNDKKFISMIKFPFN